MDDLEPKTKDYLNLNCVIDTHSWSKVCLDCPVNAGCITIESIKCPLHRSHGVKRRPYIPLRDKAYNLQDMLRRQGSISISEARRSVGDTAYYRLKRLGHIATEGTKIVGCTLPPKDEK